MTDSADVFGDALLRYLADGAPPASVKLRTRALELGRQVRKKQRIYLDTRFWIFLRDADHGSPQDDDHVLLLRQVRSLVKDGVVACPVTDFMISEIMSQRDRDSRLRTAKLMDELSTGIALAPFDDRVRAEIWHWLDSFEVDPNRLHAPLDFAWTSPSFAMGHLLPTIDNVDEETQAAIDSAWIDGFSQMSLFDIIEKTPESALQKLYPMPSVHESLNKGKFNNLVPDAEFSQLVHEELIGAVDVLWDRFVEVLAAKYHKRGGQGQADSVPSGTKAQFGALIAAAYKNDKLNSGLATLQVLAEVHAALRWDQKRRFKPGDWHDALHAAAALPYFQLFLTDRPLAHLLNSPPVSIGSRLGTQMISELPEVLDALAALDAASEEMDG